MNRFLAHFLTLALLVLVACTPAASPSPQATPTSVALAIPAASSPTPAPTVVIPTPDWTRLSQALVSTNPGQADQTLAELTTWARDASGLRTELGDQADEIFDLAEQAQWAAVQDLVRKVQSGAKPKGMPAPLPPRARVFVGPGDYEGILTLLQVLITTPLSIDPRAGNGNPITSSNETNQVLGENARSHAKFTATVAGSELQVQVDLTIRVEKGGKVYEEQASGQIKLSFCPDPQGNVPMDIALQTKGDSSGGGYGLNVSSHAVGHVDDDAILTSIDQDLQSELSMTKGKNWLNGTPDTSFAQVNLSYTTEGLGSKNPNNIVVSNTRWSMPRSSWFVSQDIPVKAVEMGMSLAGTTTLMVLKIAEHKWQDGKCVAITVTEGEEQLVVKGSENPFTAIVRHKIQGDELTVPVIATLKSGKVSVSPSGKKVPARATFRYQAPDQVGGDGATVELITRSRRGIGKLDIRFKTHLPFFSIDTPWMGSQIRLAGSICGLDKPFTLELAGVKPGANFPYAGQVVFTPKDTTGGTWLATGGYPVTGGGNTKDSGGSTYQLTGLEGGNPQITLSAFTQTGIITPPPEAARIMHAQPQVVTHDWPGTQIPMTPLNRECLP